MVFVCADSDSDVIQWLTAYITVNAGESSMDRRWFPNPALMICVALEIEWTLMSVKPWAVV